MFCWRPISEVGVVLSPLSKYEQFNTRICRPIGLTDKERKKIIDYALARVGMQYDNKQIFDLARYLFPYPPVPVFLRRRLLAIGSGDPTRAICSTLIAEAFESIHYPILPESVEGAGYGIAPFVQSETEHIRKHGLYTPRDFDISPYFAVIKPVIVNKFDYHTLEWSPKKSAPIKKVRTRRSKTGRKQRASKIGKRVIQSQLCGIDLTRLSVGINRDVRKHAIGNRDVFVTYPSASPAFNFYRQ